MSEVSIERSIWLDVPIRRVWRAITDPNQLAVWYEPRMAWQMSTFEVGARLEARCPQTGAARYALVVEALDTPHRLVHRAVAATPDVAGRTSYTLTPDDGGTRLTLAWSEFPGADSAPVESVSRMLANLQALTEEHGLPRCGAA